MRAKRCSRHRAIPGFGVTRSVSGRLAASDQVVRDLGSGDFKLGSLGFAFARGSVSFRPGDAASPRVRLQGVAVTGPGGWRHNGTLDLELGPNLSFSVPAGGTSIGPVGFGDCRLECDNGELKVTASKSVSVHLADMTCAMEMQSNGAVSGTLKGHVKVSLELRLQPPRPPGLPAWAPDPPSVTKTVSVDFGEHTIAFDGSRFAKRVELQGFKEGGFLPINVGFDFSWQG